MNRVDPRNSPSGDELDALLGAFFKAEKPDPWPAFQAPQSRPQLLPFRPASAPARSWQVLATRAALAASVTLLLLGSWLLPGSLPTPRNGGTIPTEGEGTAGRNILPHGTPGRKSKGPLHLDSSNGHNGTEGLRPEE